jgi:hypothetical protein
MSERRPAASLPPSHLRELANQRCAGSAYRRLLILLREEDEPAGVNRIYRLCATVYKRRSHRTEPSAYSGHKIPTLITPLEIGCSATRPMI